MWYHHKTDPYLHQTILEKLLYSGLNAASFSENQRWHLERAIVILASRSRYIVPFIQRLANKLKANRDNLRASHIDQLPEHVDQLPKHADDMQLEKNTQQVSRKLDLIQTYLVSVGFARIDTDLVPGWRLIPVSIEPIDAGELS